jgi:hypothetical protein
MWKSAGRVPSLRVLPWHLPYAVRCVISRKKDLKFDIRQNFAHKAMCSMGCCNISAKTFGKSIHIAQLTPSVIEVTLELET